MPPTDLFFVVTGARQVFMAKEMETMEIVAVKKIRMDNERDDFPIKAIREIKILKKLHHQNIVNLEKVVTSPGLTNITRIRALFWQTPLGRGLRLVLIVLRTERDEEGKQSMILNKNTIESFALLLI